MTTIGGCFHRLKLIGADGGRAGRVVQWAKHAFGRTIEIVKRPDLGRFVVLPECWIVERTFGWLGPYRRLSKGYPTLPESSETRSRIGIINLMIHRLSAGQPLPTHVLRRAV